MKFQKLYYVILCGALMLVASCSDGEDDQNGLPGADGLSCWDANNNGNADPEEDLNQDGNFNALDCAGANGTNGTDGLSCWDTNGNGAADPEEDINQDGNFDTQDCQGTNGTNGTDGISCWDTNGNGVGDEEEDLNQDGNFDAQDCQGTNGENGADGVNCWDTNGNGVANPEEDVNEDGDFNALDCQGEDGENGEEGNANVQRFDVLFEEGLDTDALDIDINDQALPISDYAYLVYLLDGDNGGIASYQIPGFISVDDANDAYAFLVILNSENPFFRIVFYEPNLESTLLVPLGNEIAGVRYFAIRVNEDQASRGGSKGVYDDLKAAGVDVSDYHQVAKYFGYTD
ncbi:MAG: hypothetical protein AAFU57_16660 [Bacteroidota bacterium]